MKKLLLFCLLSVFMSMTYIANAQSPGSGCCFWLENDQPDTPADLYNLNPMSTSAGDVQYYYFKIANYCGLDPNSKVSIDWQITVNGQPLDAINAGLLNIEIETRNPMGNLSANDGFIPSGQLLSGQGFNSALGCPAQTDYPGGLGGSYPNSYCPNQTAFSYYNLGTNNNLYNYFYVHFLQYASDNNLIRLKINRKSFADYSIKVKLIERIGGEAYENPYRPAQGTTHYYIGGKLAQRGVTLATFTLDEQTYRADSRSACSGTPILVGRDPQGQPYSYVMSPILPELSAQMVVDVPFYNTNWTCVDYIDSMVTYTLTWAAAPAEPNVADQTRCGAGTITFTGAHSLEPGIDNLIYRWYDSADLTNLLHEGNTFTTPELAEDQEISYWVTASIVTGCEGLPQEVTAKAFKQPIVTLTFEDDFCPDAGTKTVMAVVTNAYDTEIPYGPEDIPAIPALTGFDLTVNWTGATQTSISNGTIYANVPVTNACNATYTYSVLITDDVSGCTATASESFTLVDTEAPTFYAPATFTAYKGVGCALDIDPTTTGEPYDISDNCDDPNIVITRNDVITLGTCVDNYTITRTWTVTDHCGNATSHDQIITVVDNTPPTIETNTNTYVAIPSPNCTFVVTNALLEEIAEDFNATDNCSNVTVTYSVTAGTAISQPTTVTLTFADACGNETEANVVVVLPEPMENSFTVSPSTADGCYGTEFRFEVTVTNGVAPYEIEWDNLSLTGFNPSITPTLTNINTDQNFTYSYTVTDVNGCTTSNEITVTVYGAPAFELTPSHAICFGEETQLSVTYGSGVASVYWSTTETTDQITVQPEITTTYTVMLTSVHGCTAEKSVTVTVNPLPVFEVSKISDDSYCVGDNGAISILPNDGTYNYFNGAVQITLPYDELAVGTYTITAVNPTTGCSATAQPIEILDAIVLPVATLNISDIDDHCLYNDITVDILATSDQANTSFYITVNDVEIPNVNGVANYTFTQAGVYTFEVVTTNTVTGCVSSVVSEEITIDPLPVNPTLSVNDSEICLGDLVTLTATPHVTGYTYTYAGFDESYINTLHIIPSVLGVNTYSVIITTEHGCTATATVDVTVNALPVIESITADNSCPNTTTNVTAVVSEGTPDYTYAWSGDVSGTTNPIQLTDLTCGAVNDISLQVTDSKGCIATSSTTITLVDETDPTIAFENPSDNDIIATCTNIPAASSFTLVVADNCTPTAQLDVTTPNDVIVNQTCAYRYDIQRTWTVTDYCGNSSSITQTIHIFDETAPTFTVPADIAICKNNDNLYDASVEITGDVEVYSDNCTPIDDLVVAYTQVVNEGTATETGSILRTWTVTDVCGNSASATQTITLNPAPVAQLVVDPTSFCLPDAGLEVTATLTGTPGTETYNYSITLPDASTVTTSTASINITNPGTHTFTGFVTNSTTLCASALVSATTEALLYPEFEITNVINKRGCRDDVDSLNGSFFVTPQLDYTYTISPNVGSYTPHTFSNLPEGPYQITATHNDYNCSFTIDTVIKFNPIYTPLAEFRLGGRDADTAICWVSGLYLNTSVSDLNRVSTHQYNYHIIVPENVTANGNSGVTILQPGIYQIGGIVENITTGCRDTSWHYVYAMAYPSVDVTANPFCLDTEVTLTATATPALNPPHYYAYTWTSTNTGTTILNPVSSNTLTHLTTTPNKYYADATANYSYTGVNVYGAALSFNLGCTSRDSLTVTPLPLPVFTAQQASAKRVCNARDTGTISITDGWNSAYTWTATQIRTGNTFSITTQTFQVPDSGYYSITATDLNGCVYTLNNILVNEIYVGFNAVVHASNDPLIPTNDYSSNLSFCWDHAQEAIFHEVRYTNDIRFSYQYTFLLPTNINPANSDSSYVTAAGSYLLRGYVTNLTTGCVSNIDSIYVYAVPTPQYQISPDVTICDGASIKVGITPISTFTATWATTPTATVGDSILITQAMYGVTPTFTLPVTISATLLGSPLVCSVNDEVVITINIPPVINVESTITPVSCFGGSNGTIAATAEGTGVLSYLWSTGANTPTITGLTVGSYTLTVTDPVGCTDVETFTITQPLAPLSSSISSQTNVLCYGNATGSATVTGVDGTSPYRYAWPQGSNLADTTNLLAGTYIVTITDANNCTTTQSVTITQPLAPLSSSISSQTNVLCYGNATGSATVTGVDGTSPYRYAWPQGSNLADTTNLLAGTYIVTITDANNCTTTQSVTITQPLAPLSSSISSQTNVLCYGNPTGSATVTGVDGTSPYRYAWPQGSNLADTTNLLAGTYIVTITDANNCTTTQSVTITQPATAVSASTTPTHVKCYGGNDGSAVANPSGGVGPYTYSWNTSPVQTDQTATGLTAGTYIVTVTDANYCTTTASALITHPSALNSSISATTPICTGSTTPINLTVTGGTPGTPAYTFLWSTTETTEDITVGAGTYYVTVKDGNLCQKIDSVTITNFATPTITSNEPPHACLGVDFTVTATSTQTGTWSAQAYDALTDAMIGAPQATNAYLYTGTATPDTIYIVYTFVSSIGTCTYYHQTENIKITVEPRLRVYDSSGDNLQTINQYQNTDFHFMVEACGTDVGTRLALTYSIYYQEDATDAPVLINDLTEYVSNNSIRYEMFFTGTGLQSSYPSGFNYLAQDPNSHFPLAPSVVISGQQFDFFRLYYLAGREGNVDINHFKKAGIYTFEYALISNYDDVALTIPHGNQVAVNVDAGQRLGGNQFFTGTYYTKVWSTNTMTITVNPAPAPIPSPIQNTPIEVSTVTPELKVYPNPTTPEQSVNVELTHFKGDAILTVTSVNGQVIERVPVTIADGQKSVIHTITNNVPGMYFVTITTKETILTKKLIIQPK